MIESATLAYSRRAGGVWLGRQQRARHPRKLSQKQLTEESFPKDAALRNFFQVAQEFRRLLVAEFEAARERREALFF